jgi:hypothetical protein
MSTLTPQGDMVFACLLLVLCGVVALVRWVQADPCRTDAFALRIVMHLDKVFCVAAAIFFGAVVAFYHFNN